ncbi:MAG: hypothetical protein K8S25_07755 [Alphaproteobacteria bacterium]|nr:hypothetical protein [Alphaproteobacteria bacterium]
MSAQTAKRQVSVGWAITIGLIWVNGPILPHMLGMPAVALVLLSPLISDGFAGLAMSVLFALGFVLAWFWWSVNVSKWRLWAYERVADIQKLKNFAVAVGLTWPDGHVFERTEIKSKADAARERDFEGKKR